MAALTGRRSRMEVLRHFFDFFCSWQSQLSLSFHLFFFHKPFPFDRSLLGPGGSELQTGAAEPKPRRHFNFPRALVTAEPARSLGLQRRAPPIRWCRRGGSPAPPSNSHISLTYHLCGICSARVLLPLPVQDVRTKRPGGFFFWNTRPQNSRHKLTWFYYPDDYHCQYY